MKSFSVEKPVKSLLVFREKLCKRLYFENRSMGDHIVFLFIIYPCNIFSLKHVISVNFLIPVSILRIFG